MDDNEGLSADELVEAKQYRSVSMLTDAGARLADAQVEHARAFQLAKARNPGITDGHATQIAIEETDAIVTRMQAAYDSTLILMKADIPVEED